jgi:hypothetical protein
MPVIPDKNNSLGDTFPYAVRYISKGRESQCVFVNSRFGVCEASIRLAKTIASDVSLLVTFNHAIDSVIQTNPNW